MSRILRRCLLASQYPLILVLGLMGMALPGHYLCRFYCPTHGLLTLAAGCSDWPDVLRGALYILPFMLILKWRPGHAWFAAVPALLITSLGGLYEVASGSGFNSESLESAFALLLHGYDVLLGAGCAMLVWYCSSQRIMRFWAALAEP